MRPRPGVWILLLTLIGGAGCDVLLSPGGGYDAPRETADGWEVASLSEVGMEEDTLLALLDLIASTPDHLIHSILIVKDQKLVFEEYWPGLDMDPRTYETVYVRHERETLHWVASVSKSFTSALVGIAIDRGYIDSVHEPLFSFFPEYAHLERADNSKVTIEHLLSFSSGFNWNEHEYGFDDPRDSHYQMFTAQDPMGFLLGRPTVFPSGGEFEYNSGDTNILGEIVARVSASRDLAEFADLHLLQPLGIDSFGWTRFPLADSVVFASGGASLRPRDIAKLGALYLNRGSWNDTRIISEDWVARSTRMAVPLVGDYRTLYGYGYNWWLGRSAYREGRVEYFRASGWGGQSMYVYPELDMIVVFTAGGYYVRRPLSMNDIIEHYIFAAIVE